MNPVIYLRGVRHADLERLVEFIYLGKYIYMGAPLKEKGPSNFSGNRLENFLRKIVFISVSGFLIFEFK